MRWFCLLVVVILWKVLFVRAFAETLDLNELQWTFRSKNGTVFGQASVPGDIYSDLLGNGIIGQPLYGQNDQKLHWVAATDWIYECLLTIPENWNNYAAVLLKIGGLDTVATIWLNGELIFRSDNQFVSHLIGLEVWKPGPNNLTIQFTSPTEYSAKQAADYHASHFHDVPPNCPPAVYHGECHANFIRKIQASFSWDWGPSFPTVGIWQPISLVATNTAYIYSTSAKVRRVDDRFVVTVELLVFSAVAEPSAQLSVSLPELSIWGASTTALLPGHKNLLVSNFEVPVSSVELWWPNGYGSQQLYALYVGVKIKDVRIDTNPLKLGFRTIELVQNHIDVENLDKGRNFYFKINNIPIFLKGSNWIPISAFPAQNHSERLKFLLDSVTEANMNALRVWGGGRYETDEFYELADQKGILLWHDFMFACALYPAETRFLLNVRKEVTEQVRRLMFHPSVLVWAGNNENELAVAGKWWRTENYSLNETIYDYVKLYRETIQSTVVELDDTRPYLLSSPSNGIETEEAGGVSENPGDPRYGDIHFYDEFLNLWKDYVYRIPRCATEYGVQSLPRKETMLRWLNESEWSFLSKTFLDRQHHPGGIMTLFLMVFSHFRLPLGCANANAVHECDKALKAQFLKRFTYYTQMHQAIAYQTQTEHYRRWRGRFNSEGLGNTMCALYWQLNDIWAAPTWSSIDFELSWKPVHYFARRFFADVVLSTFLDAEKNLEVYVVSDLQSTLYQCKFTVDMFAFTGGLQPIYGMHKSIDVPALASTRLDISEILSFVKRNEQSGEDEYLIRARLYSSDGKQIGYDNVLLPDRLFKTDESVFGIVVVSSFQMLDVQHYVITLSTTKIAPLVLVQLERPVIGWFSDNGFTMTEPQRSINLTIWEVLESPVQKEDIRVCSLADCGL